MFNKHFPLFVCSRRPRVSQTRESEEEALVGLTGGEKSTSRLRWAGPILTRAGCEFNMGQPKLTHKLCFLAYELLEAIKPLLTWCQGPDQSDLHSGTAYRTWLNWLVQLPAMEVTKTSQGLVRLASRLDETSQLASTLSHITKSAREQMALRSESIWEGSITLKHQWNLFFFPQCQKQNFDHMSSHYWYITLSKDRNLWQLTRSLSPAKDVHTQVKTCTFTGLPAWSRAMAMTSSSQGLTWD